MPMTQHTDVNGTYYAIGTAAWYGEEGVRLREMGWRYCGYGTYGVIIAQGSNPCYTKSASPDQPFIGLPVPEDVQQPSIGPTGSVADKACGTCRKSSTTTAPAPAIVPSPTTPGTMVPAKSKFPWWLLILLLILAKELSDGRNNRR